MSSVSPSLFLNVSSARRTVSAQAWNCLSLTDGYLLTVIILWGNRSFVQTHLPEPVSWRGAKSMMSLNV